MLGIPGEVYMTTLPRLKQQYIHVFQALPSYLILSLVQYHIQF